MRRTSNWLRLLGLIAMTVIAQNALAATCTAKTGGALNWNSRNTWTNCNNTIPQNGDAVIIPNGSTVTLNRDTNQLSSLTVNAGGSLAGDNSGNGYTLDLSGGPGNLTNNGTITLVDQNINIGGNFINNGTFNAGAIGTAGVVTFLGATPTIGGTSPTTFTYLDLSNTSSVLLGNNVTVVGTLTGPVTLTSTCPTDYTLTSNGGATVQHSCPPTAITSLNLASANPTAPGTAVSWTLLFSKSVTGVATGNFALVQAGGVNGASITSVTGSGTTWTVNVNTGSGSGTLGLNMVNVAGVSPAVSTTMPFVGQAYTIPTPFSCAPPSNIPAGVSVTCQCDNFNRASLNPSTIFNGNWLVNSSGTTTVYPYINQTTGLLRLTENSGNNATSATVPGIFPAAGNYISVEFQQYAYNGSGADGIAVTLSDYSVPPVPGAFGGSLGYAQKTGINGFAGGWVGIALDEYGNYENGNEGRYGGISGSLYPQSVGVRGSGAGSSNVTPNYPWLTGATALNPGIDNRTSTTPSRGYYYQVIVDARNAGNATPQTFVAVNRDTSGSGSAYAPIITPFDIFSANASQAPVPANWQISFTGSTGGSTNIHEIGSLRICAQSIVPPTGGTASGFSAIDEAYPAAPTIPAYTNFKTGHIFMKLPATPFKLWVAALSSNGISTAYSVTSTKYVEVKLVDNSNSICGTDTARTCNSTCTNSSAVENGGRQIVTFSQGGPGASLSPSFTLNSSWKNLIAVMKECTTSACTAFTTTTPACSADSFSVRPTGIASVTSSTATNTGVSGTPTFQAGSGQFDLTATTVGVAGSASGYTGTPKINSTSVQPASPATVTGALAGTFSAAISGTPSSTATGTTFSYSEVGGFYLQAPDFAIPRIPGVYDDSWTATDSDPLKNDCNSGTTAAAYSNTKDASGKYGCNFGITANTAVFGRFVPDHFDTAILPVAGVPMPCPSGQICPVLYNGFVYSGQAFTTQVIARNQAGFTTQNYAGGYAKNVTLSAWDALGSTVLQNPSGGTLNNPTVAAASFAAGIATTNTSNYAFATMTTVPTNIYLRAVDTDNVTSLRATNPTTTSVEGGVKVASGRVKVSNAYGSELLPLTLRATAQYYTGTGWLNSTTDSVTKLASINASYSVGAGTSNVTVSPASKVLSSGSLNINLSAPNSSGTVILAPTIDPASPGNPPFAVGTGTIIPGTATFGVYNSKNSYIYRRESY